MAISKLKISCLNFCLKKHKKNWIILKRKFEKKFLLNNLAKKTWYNGNTYYLNNLTILNKIIVLILFIVSWSLYFNGVNY